jgi:hypothetical protein
MHPELAALSIADPPEVWAELGFTVDAGSVDVSGVRHVLGAEGRGITGWSFRGAGERDEIDGVPFSLPSLDAPPTPAHPNGVLELDHLVLVSPDLDRTIAAFEGAGIPLRRTRDTGTDERPMRQAFFKVAGVILELAGPRTPSGEGPLRFFGLAWTVRDLDETASYFGERLHAAKDAVQPGRRIATLDRAAGSSVAMAFMSPEP